MKNFKQLKQSVIKINKSVKVKAMINRAFGNSHENFGFTYLD